MDDAVNIRMRLKDFVEIVLFFDIDMEEFGPLPADELDAIDGFFRRVQEIVCDDNFVV